MNPYGHVFHNVSFWEKSPVHHMPTAINSPPPLLFWYYQQTKKHTTIHCIGIYNITLFTEGCAVLSD